MRSRRLRDFLLGACVACQVIPASAGADDKVTGKVRLDTYGVEAQEIESLFEIFTPGGKFGAKLDEQAWFTIPGVAPGPDLELLWRYSKDAALPPARLFVLWPYRHPGQGQNPYEFRLNLLTDVKVLALQWIGPDIERGEFASADTKVQDALALLAGAESRPPMVDEARRLRIAILRDVAAAASRYRAGLGRSAVSVDMIRRERDWMRKRIGSWTGAPTRMEELSFDLGDWALFSREVYSFHQQAWPARSLAEDTDERLPLLHDKALTTMLEEDISLVQQALRRNDLAGFLAGPTITSRLVDLDSIQRELLSDVGWLDADPRSVPMNRLSLILDALRLLR